jgi:hypothetical protein
MYSKRDAKLSALTPRPESLIKLYAKLLIVTFTLKTEAEGTSQLSEISN